MISRTWLIGTDCTNPYANLALEEYLMDTVEPGSCVLYLWRNRHTVVIGQNQNAWQECKVKELEDDGGFLARRLSGGGAVFHDLGNLNFTFLMPRAEFDVTRQTEVILRAVSSYGLEVERSGRNDLTVGGRKFSGNAFYKRGGGAYHHGTLLLDVDMDKLSRYLNVSQDKLRSKGVRSVASRVANLREFCPEITLEGMKERLALAFGQVYGAEPKALDPEGLDRARIDWLAARNGSWEWRLGRPLPFDAEFSARFTWGGVSLRFSVQGGVIRRVEAYSDAMDSAFIGGLPAAFEGRPYSSKALIAALEAQEAASDHLGFEADDHVRKDIQQWLDSLGF